jgi:hypothetical protein
MKHAEHRRNGLQLSRVASIFFNRQSHRRMNRGRPPSFHVSRPTGTNNHRCIGPITIVMSKRIPRGRGSMRCSAVVMDHRLVVCLYKMRRFDRWPPPAAKTSDLCVVGLERERKLNLLQLLERVEPAVFPRTTWRCHVFQF